jgi:phosphoglycerate kinase
LHLPVDFICADKFEGATKVETYNLSTGIPKGMMGLDCGPETILLNGDAIARANTIVWNGP